MLPLVLVTTSTLLAQTPAEIEAEPIVKLQPGETNAPGQCLTQQELDLIDRLNALRRPTVGVEGEDQGDDPAPFDPHYFVGSWTFEGVMPESPLGEAGDFIGTETVRHVNGCTYKSTLDATVADRPVTITTRMFYDRQMRYLLRIEDDSRGFEFLKMGRVGGDPGGFFSHHWEAPAVTNNGTMVRLRGRTYITSPFAYRLQLRIGVNDGPFTNFGSIWWDRVDDEP
jgi:hypothetical protein